MTSEASLRRPASILLAMHLVVLAVIGGFPVPVDRGASPFIGWFVRSVQAAGAPWFSYDWVEFSANVALFVPLGVLGVMVVGRRRWWLAVAGGVATSVVIEAVQWMLLPERFPTPWDVLANTLGAAVGAALGYVVLALRAGGARTGRFGASPDRPVPEQPGQGRPSPW